ncbi:hypothetical protein SAMN05414139_05447 [Burkholderia sp. D7]|nr:hypothetical protein SAMN05414139_05447 [Burkholderia sp. D7]
MLYLSFVVQVILLVASTWTFFDDKMGRTPLRMACVGLVLCAAGIFLGASIANFEGTNLFRSEHAQLELVGQLINVVITAAGGNILASALVLRADIANQRSIAEARQRLRTARATIVDLRRAQKHSALEESFHSQEQISKRSSATWNLIQNAMDDYRDANELLAKMGLKEDEQPYPRRKQNPSGRRV